MVNRYHPTYTFAGRDWMYTHNEDSCMGNAMDAIFEFPSYTGWP
jgi:hypothetical protein